MTEIELLADTLARSLDMLNMTLADFTDAEMLVRPSPGANHAAWQLGHLIVAEGAFVNPITPGALPELPAGFAEKFTKETATIDDPKAFPSKAELLAQFGKTRAAMVAWAKSLTPADLNKPGPMPSFTPTVGHVLTLTPFHLGMHLGQFQVIRRKLGKKVLF